MDTKNCYLVHSDFPALVAHELRTPLTIIRGYAELLSSVPCEKLHDIQNKMVGQCGRMERIIQGLLLLAGAENRPLDNQQPFDLIATVNRCADIVRAVRPDTQIQCHYDRPNCLLDGHADLMEMAVSNILENSVKYSEKPAQIFIALTQAASDITLSIRDCGIGIPEEALPHVFTPFYTVHKHTGVGLGLSLVQTIVVKHRGSIAVQSTMGTGTEVTICLTGHPRFL